MREKLRPYLPYLKVFAVYTLIFLVIVNLIEYMLPFLLSLTIAVVMKPVYDYMKKRLRFQPSFSATVITLFIFSVMLFVVAFIAFLIIRELIGLLMDNREFLSSYIARFDSLEEIYQTATASDTLERVTAVAEGVFRGVPMVITFVIVTFALSIFFLNHLTLLKEKLLQRIGIRYREKCALVLRTGYLTVRRFIRSYMILYIITFVEAVFVYFLTKTPYPLVYALITAIADLLPVLGPGTVYLPIAVWHILQGQNVEGITIAVFFLITVIIRQIIEPKIVSDNVKVSSLLILCALYFSIVSMNFGVLFYIVIAALLYKILKASRVFEDESAGIRDEKPSDNPQKREISP